MSAARFLACGLLALGANVAAAQDGLNVVGGLDVRWIHATGELSYLNGGLGIQIGRAHV